MGAPTFSIVIPCHDQGRFLRTAIRSAVHQTGHLDTQVVVVNDGSQDDTLAVASDFGNRIEVIDQRRQGPSAARNAGLRIAKGEFVNFLDADDWLDPDFLRLHAAASAASDAAVFVGEWTLCDVDANPISHGAAEIPVDAYRFLLGGNPLPCHCLVASRAAVAAVGSFDESLDVFEDWDLWLRMALAGHRFHTVRGPRAFYRRHVGTLSRDVDRMLNGARRVLRQHSGRHALVRRRATMAIRYGLFRDNVLAGARCIWQERGAWAACKELLAFLRQRPGFLESLLVHWLFAVFPPLRRSLGQARVRSRF